MKGVARVPDSLSVGWLARSALPSKLLAPGLRNQRAGRGPHPVPPLSVSSRGPGCCCYVETGNAKCCQNLLKKLIVSDAVCLFLPGTESPCVFH